MSLIKDQLAKVGIDLKITVMESAALTQFVNNRKWDGMVLGSQLQSHPITCLDNFIGSKSNANTGMVYDPKYDSDLADLEQTFDLSARMAKTKALNVYSLSMSWVVAVCRAYTFVMWQPWLKGYNGEYKLSIYNTQARWKYVWLDQQMMKAATGR